MKKVDGDIEEIAKLRGITLEQAHEQYGFKEFQITDMDKNYLKLKQ